MRSKASKLTFTDMCDGSCFLAIFLFWQRKSKLPSFCWEVFYLQFETIREKIGEVLAQLIRFA